MKAFVILLISLLLMACNAEQSKPDDEIKVITVSIHASGELISRDNAIISPPQAKNMWQYKITYMAEEGKNITKGRPLIRFDDSQLQLILGEKHIELQTAQKKLENSQLEIAAKAEELKLKLAEAKMQQQKAQRKSAQSLGLESQIESRRLAIQYQLANDNVIKFISTIAKNKQTSEAKIASIESDIKRLSSEVAEYQSSIDSMMIRSPKNGIVVYKSNRQGDKSSVGDSVWMGQQIIELPSLDALMLKAEILEADAGKIAVGQKVDIILDAASDRVFQGKIEKLGSIFRRKSIDQPNIIFDADIHIEHIDTNIMRPGMAARITIYTMSQEANANE